MSTVSIRGGGPSTLARELGARGSRIDLTGATAASEVPAAAAAVLAAVPAWWSHQARVAGLDGPWLDVAFALDAPGLLVDPVSPSAAVTPTVSSEAVGSAYTAALSPATRARHGRHYTPADLADQLWAMTRRGLRRGVQRAPMPGKVLDPACGAGALLLPALREHLGALTRSDPQLTLNGLPSVIEGIDADPAAVWLANVLLAAEALPVLARVPASRRRPLPAMAAVGDGLAVRTESARVVLMNPPYGRVKLGESERSRFAHVLYGHANLYGVFMGSAIDYLESDGVLSALVPTSFTAGRYFSNLRAELGRKAPLREVSFVAEREGVFTGVLQETCLATFTRRQARRTAVSSFVSVATPVASVASPRGSDPWILPRRSDDAVVAAAAAKMPNTLRSMGWKVSTGPLVWNRRRDDLGAGQHVDAAPVLWAADIDGGVIHRDPVRDSLRYLRIRNDRDARTMCLSAPAVLVQRTTAPEQTRRVVVADLGPAQLRAWGGEVVVENHVNVLRSTEASPSPSRELLARILGTRTIDRVVRCLSGSVALSAFELESLPLPTAEVLRAWEALKGDDLEAAVSVAYRPVDA